MPKPYATLRRELHHPHTVTTTTNTKEIIAA
jgi:hypothetical protein